ncbi:hypothetical protein APA_3255 [Pseudanabaena sp. lw0831]|nr:hypothetical protein APA_3255 [Pseudanabaena sp. lw0831]
MFERSHCSCGDVRSRYLELHLKEKRSHALRDFSFTINRVLCTFQN